MPEGTVVAAGELVNYAGGLYRKGKTAISAELAGIFDPLRSSAES